MPEFSNTQKGIFFTILGAWAFAFKTILAKLIYQYGVDPLSLLCLRLTVAGAIFFAVLLINLLRCKWSLKFGIKSWSIIILLGFCGYYLCSYLDFKGLYFIDASLGRMILFLYPTMVVLINAVVNKKPITKATALALVVSYLGLILMMAPQVRIKQNSILLGSTLVFLSALIYAFYLTAVDKFFKDVGMGLFISLIMCFATIFVYIHYSIAGNFSVLFTFNPIVYIYCLILGVFCTVVPIYAMSAGIAFLGASKAAMYNMSGPIVTLLMGALILHERLGPIEILGVILIIFGVSRINN